MFKPPIFHLPKYSHLFRRKARSRKTWRPLGQRTSWGGIGDKKREPNIWRSEGFPEIQFSEGLKKRAPKTQSLPCNSTEAASEESRISTSLDYSVEGEVNIIWWVRNRLFLSKYYVMLFLSHTTLVPWRGLERGDRFGGNPGSRRRLEPAPQYRFPRSESSSLQTDLFPTQ